MPLQTLTHIVARGPADAGLGARLFTEARQNAAAARALNAFIALPEQPPPAPPHVRSGPNLHGAPIAVKDNIAVAGYPLTGGTRAIPATEPGTDAGCVAALRRAGAVPFGKTGMHELAFGVTGNNGAFGAIENPRVPGAAAGGSSGGSAAAVAAGIVPAALASDTGGSGRIPAAWCGCAGFRPTTGRYPATGVLNLSWTLDTVTTMANDVADLSLLDTILAPSPQAAPALPETPRLGVPSDSFAAELDDPVAGAFETALNDIARSGAELVEVELAPALDIDRRAGAVIAGFEAGLIWSEMAQALGGTDAFVQAMLSADVRAVFEDLFANPVAAGDYRRAVAQDRPALREVYAGCFRRYGIDALVFPTVAVLAPALGEDDVVRINGVARPLFATCIRNTSPAAVAGIPSLSVPFGQLDDGAPLGISLDALWGQDRYLLALGERLAA